MLTSLQKKNSALIDHGEKLANIFHGLNSLWFVAARGKIAFEGTKLLLNLYFDRGREKMLAKWMAQLTISVVIRHFQKKAILIKFSRKLIFMIRVLEIQRNSSVQ